MNYFRSIVLKIGPDLRFIVESHIYWSVYLFGMCLNHYMFLVQFVEAGNLTLNNINFKLKKKKKK